MYIFPEFMFKKQECQTMISLLKKQENNTEIQGFEILYCFVWLISKSHRSDYIVYFFIASQRIRTTS